MNHDFLASEIDGYKSWLLEEQTVRYIDLYWINRETLERDWATRIESVFKRTADKVSIAEGYVVDFLQGGILFTKEEFAAFVARSKATGATKFAVVEDIGQRDWHALQEFDFFRFSYPIDIDWGEMTRTGMLARDVFERPIRCFFVITDNAKTGKYTNNDASSPYDIVFHAT